MFYSHGSGSCSPSRLVMKFSLPDELGKSQDTYEHQITNCSERNSDECPCQNLCCVQMHLCQLHAGTDSVPWYSEDLSRNDDLPNHGQGCFRTGNNRWYQRWDYQMGKTHKWRESISFGHLPQSRGNLPNTLLHLHKHDGKTHEKSREEWDSSTGKPDEREKNHRHDWSSLTDYQDRN